MMAIVLVASVTLLQLVYSFVSWIYNITNLVKQVDNPLGPRVWAQRHFLALIQDPLYLFGSKIDAPERLRLAYMER